MPRKTSKTLANAKVKVKKLKAHLKKAQQELKSAIVKAKKKKPTQRVVRASKKRAKKKTQAKVQRRRAKKKVVTEKATVTAKKLVADWLNIGDKAPEFTAVNDNNQLVALTDFRGQSVVLYFYPKDDTPGCTKEANDFTATRDQFTAKNAVILGVSRDTVDSHCTFKEKYNINYSLLADPEEVICALYGVIKNKNMYGKPVRAIERSTFLIDKQGTIQHIWRDVNVTEHVDEVLNAIDQMR